MANRRIEYVFGPPRPASGHSLGISAMTLSKDVSLTASSYATLFTGGRDGRLNAWALSPLQGAEQATQAARVSDLHTNWVSDVQHLSDGMVASCSADTTVKFWNARSGESATVGHHTDYAQCLTVASPDIVVSGGLDERIRGWSVSRAVNAAGSSTSHTQQPTPLFDISAGHSIYAIASAPPNLIVCGSSDGAVRIWDSRQKGHYVAKFTGHTDSVRCLFVDAGGDTVVSGSSDATVRVWSLRTGRVFKTMNQFRSSVWSVQPHGNGIVAGDRDGNIYETDSLAEEPRIIVEHAVQEGGLKGLCEDPVTGNMWVGTPFSPDIRCISRSGNRAANGKLEIETLRGHKGLRKHRILNDKRRALVMDTDGEVSMVDLVCARLLEFHRKIDVEKEQDPDAVLEQILDEVNTMDVLDNWCQVQTKCGQVCVMLDHRSINNTEVYLDDLMKHVSHTSQTPQPTPNPSPGVTPVHSPLSTPVGSGFFRQSRSPLISPAVSRVTSAHSLTEIAQQQQQQQQQRLIPRLGTGQGGAKFYDPEDEEHSRKKKMQQKQEAQLSTAAAKAAADIKTEQSGDDEQEEPADSETADDEIRINLGNYVLENLLRGVVSRLQKQYDGLPQPPALRQRRGQPTGANSQALGAHLNPNSSSAASQNSSSHSGGGNSSLFRSRSVSGHGEGRESRRARFFSKILGMGKRREEDRAGSPPSASSSSMTPTSSTTTETNSGSETPQQIKQKNQQQQQNEPDSSSFAEAWTRAVANRSMHSADPESPEKDVLSRHARLIITEIVPGAGAPTEIFSTTVGRLLTNPAEVERIEKVLPGWVGDAVLLGKLNLKSPTKIGFDVVPAPGSEDPVLTGDSTRLMAISMLRARKIMAYTVGQLQQQNVLSADATNYLPEELVSLTCQGTEVTPLMTLATIRTRIWRKGKDVVMEYTVKKKV